MRTYFKKLGKMLNYLIGHNNLNPVQIFFDCFVVVSLVGIVVGLLVPSWNVQGLLWLQYINLTTNVYIFICFLIFLLKLPVRIYRLIKGIIVL